LAFPKPLRAAAGDEMWHLGIAYTALAPEAHPAAHTDLKAQDSFEIVFALVSR